MDYETWRLRRYVARALRLGERPGRWRLNANIIAWADDWQDSLGVTIDSAAVEEAIDLHASVVVDPDLGRSIVSGWARWLRRPAPKPSRLQRNLDALGLQLGIDGPALDLFGLMVRDESSAAIDGLLDACADSSQSRRSRGRDLRSDRVMAQPLGLTPGEVGRARGGGGALLRSGALVMDGDGDVSIGRKLLRALRSADSESAFFNQLLGGRRTPMLRWSDFGHLDPGADFASRAMKGGLASGARGVNLLLYGPPGGGKTEFAAALAKRVGLTARFLGETDEDGDEPNRRERIAAVQLARALSHGGASSLFIVDEADDVLSIIRGDGHRAGSKVFLNRLLETNTAPFIWIVNDTDGIDPAMLRRMTLALHFPIPPRSARKRVLKRVSDQLVAGLAPDDIDALARSLPAAPALISGAVRVANWTGDGAEGVRMAVKGVAEAMQGGAKLDWDRPTLAAFDPTLSGADVDLDDLSNRLATSGVDNLSLLLAGPPGTGKSAFARHIASRLGLDVLEKRASDILGPYVGQTEQRIAAAFQEAEADNAMLVIDEADSLIGDRAGAERSWEVSQVNEMLAQMERRRSPFAATTNRLDALDPAALRRFNIKIRFSALAVDQAAALFARTFGMDAPLGLAALETLTPGDFVVARRKAALLGETRADALLALLEAECAMKPGLRMRIGF